MSITAPESGPDPDRDPPVTSADLAEYMKTDVPDPDTMARPVAAAVKLVEARCGPITSTEWTYLVTQDHSGALLLPSGPLASVEEVLAPDGTDVTDQVTAEDVVWRDGIIWAPSRRRGMWSVKVVTKRDAGSDDLIEAACVIAKQLWQARRAQDLRPNMGMGMDAPVDVPVPAGFAIPARAAELMADHVLPMVG